MDLGWTNQKPVCRRVSGDGHEIITAVEKLKANAMERGDFFFFFQLSAHFAGPHTHTLTQCAPQTRLGRSLRSIPVADCGLPTGVFSVKISNNEALLPVAVESFQINRNQHFHKSRRTNDNLPLAHTTSSQDCQAILLST